MVLLRESSKALGEEADLAATVGRGDGGVPHGAALVRFAEAATRGADDLAEARSALIEAVGWEGFVEVASTVGIFNGLVRTADAIGIPLDEGTRAASSALRADLGIDNFAGAGNTDLERKPGVVSEQVEKLFDF